MDVFSLRTSSVMPPPCFHIFIPAPACDVAVLWQQEDSLCRLLGICFEQWLLHIAGGGVVEGLSKYRFSSAGEG